MKRFTLSLMFSLLVSSQVFAAPVGALIKSGADGIQELSQVIMRKAALEVGDAQLLEASIKNIIRSFNGGSLDNISDDVLRQAFGSSNALTKDVSELNLDSFFEMYEQGIKRAESLISVSDNKMVSTCFSSCMGRSLREHTSMILKSVPTNQNFRAALGSVGSSVSGRDLLPEIQEALSKNFDFSTREVRRFVSNIEASHRAPLLNALGFLSEGSDAQKELGREFATLPKSVKEWMLTGEDRVMLLAVANGETVEEMDASANAVAMLIRAAKNNSEVAIQNPEDFQRGLRKFYQNSAENKEDTLRLLREKDCFGQGKYLPVL